MSRLACLAAATLVACALPAAATTISTGKPAASQPPARVYATRAQLRECLAEADALKQRFADISAASAAHDQLFDKVEKEGAALDQREAALDHDNELALQAFNADVKAHNEHVRQLNDQARQSQPVAGTYNADMADYNRRCTPLVYHVEDMDAVMKERAKAAAAASAASR